jgi:REP element-mobilizing transposase RayT
MNSTANIHKTRSSGFEEQLLHFSPFQRAFESLAVRFNANKEASMSFWRLYYHLVWATKNREPTITPNLESKLYPYLLKKAAELDVRVYALNGWLDHVHMVVSIPPKLAVADVVKNFKGASAHYLNQETASNEAFIWQRGYGVLSVGERQKSIAIAYVQSQKEHHKNTTTNAWLERCVDIDEGPSDSVTALSAVASSIRDQQEIYELMGESLI